MYLDANQQQVNSLVNEMDSRIQTLKELDLIEKLKPEFSKDGNRFHYLYGSNPMEGILGIGNTVGEAVTDFYHAFHNEHAKK